MSRLNTMMIFFVVSCCNSPVFPEFPIMESKSYNFGNREVIVGKKSINDTTFVYAICEISANKLSAACEIKFETNVFDNSKYRTSCPLHIQSELPNGGVDILDINLWNNDKAIFMWRDINQNNLRHTEVTINVVILENCDSKLHKFKADNRHDNKSQIFIFPYENSYDVIFMDRDRCDNMFCKVRVIIDGTVSEPVRYFPNSGLVIALEPTDDDSKKLLIQYGESIANDGLLKAYLVQNAGWRELKADHIMNEAAWSTSNGYISFCSERYCSFFQQDGRRITRIYLSMLHHPTMYAIFYNLPNHQQLSLACTTDLDANYHILRFIQRGDHIYSFSIEDLKCTYKPKVLTGKFLLGYGEYCLSLFFSDYINPVVYKFYKYCFVGLNIPRPNMYK